MQHSLHFKGKDYPSFKKHYDQSCVNHYHKPKVVAVGTSFTQPDKNKATTFQYFVSPALALSAAVVVFN